MENKVCCCFGHSEVYKNISAQLDEILEYLIINKAVKTFLTGGMGDFDSKFASAVRRKKSTYPEIKLILVYPYLTQEMNRNKEWYEYYFDSIIIPPEIMGVHYKSAIRVRNRWLVDNSNYIVSYVNRSFGGAYAAVCYAKQQNKKIYNIVEPVTLT